MRRRPGTLLPLELSLLDLAASQRHPFHGFEAAKLLADGAATRSLTAHGTLYKALARLEAGGLLESEWEDPERALAEGRPRRRLYRITDAGAASLRSSRVDAARTEAHVVQRSPRVA